MLKESLTISKVKYKITIIMTANIKMSKDNIAIPKFYSASFILKIIFSWKDNFSLVFNNWSNYSFFYFY